MRDGNVDMLASYFTLAGDIYPHGPTEISPWTFEERVEAAAAAGFRGFGLYYPDLVATSERLGLPTMRSILDEHGIVHVELESLGDWFTDGERRVASDRRRIDLLHAAEALGARHIKAVGDFSGQSWPIDRVIADFGALCTQARDAGTRIAVEPMPFSSITTLEDGLEIVQGADDPAGGLCLDIWHLVRGGTALERVGDIPGQLIAMVELNDGPLSATGPLWDDAVDNRVPCGDGELPIRDFLAALRRAGYDGPYGVEIMGTEYRRWPLREAAERAFESTMQQLRGG